MELFYITHSTEEAAFLSCKGFRYIEAVHDGRRMRYVFPVQAKEHGWAYYKGEGSVPDAHRLFITLRNFCGVAAAYRRKLRRNHDRATEEAKREHRPKG